MTIQKDPLKDQFFINDNDLIKEIVTLADLKKTDIVLEIGAGTGNLTKEIAKHVNKVITFEIDKKFAPHLTKLPKNVEVHFEDAWDYVQLHGKFYKKKIYNKVVANPPYSLLEPLLHNLTFLDYTKVILVIPIKMVDKLKRGIFGSFFDPQIKLNIDKSKFDPVPRTNSVAIDLVKLPNPFETRNLGLFLRRYIYQHERQKVKNSLMEGLIKYERVTLKKELTKNEARKIIKSKNIAPNFLDDGPNRLDIYDIVSKEFI